MEALADGEITNVAQVTPKEGLDVYKQEKPKTEEHLRQLRKMFKTDPRIFDIEYSDISLSKWQE